MRRHGKMYLYYSRNAYRNWVWDDDLGKYIEESNIYAVELTSAWWNDPTGTTMPTIAPRYVNATRQPGDDPTRRKDGFVPILDYDHDKQAWENADVDDYAKTGGANKDRRWAEGSTTVKRYVHGRAVYYLTYSANNFATPQYGVGYATSSSPLGPWHKYAGNPILSQDATIGVYSTGHGSIIASPDGRELYYVHHARPTPDTYRRLYTDRLRLSGSDAEGNPVMSIDASTGDEPIPPGVAPYRAQASAPAIILRGNTGMSVTWSVSSSDGAALALDNPLNRVQATIDDPSVAQLDGATATGGTVTGLRAGHTWLRLTYQREHADGSYHDVSRATAVVPVVVAAPPR